jgi:hypothetical protein
LHRDQHNPAAALPVLDRDDERSGRAHWDAVKRALADDVARRDLDAAQLTAEERVLMGLRMGALAPRTEATERELDERGRQQAQLHQRWRDLQASRGAGA